LPTSTNEPSPKLQFPLPSPSPLFTTKYSYENQPINEMALYEVHTFTIPHTFKGLLGLQYKSEAKSNTVHVSHLDNDFEADKRGVRRFDIFTFVTKTPELEKKCNILGDSFVWSSTTPV
jgi:hypothetical protein